MYYYVSLSSVSQSLLKGISKILDNMRQTASDFARKLKPCCYRILDVPGRVCLDPPRAIEKIDIVTYISRFPLFPIDERDCNFPQGHTSSQLGRSFGKRPRYYTLYCMSFHAEHNKEKQYMWSPFFYCFASKVTVKFYNFRKIGTHKLPCDRGQNDGGRTAFVLQFHTLLSLFGCHSVAISLILQSNINYCFYNL